MNGASDEASDKESYHGYSVEDEDQPPDTGDSLTDARGLQERLELGYSVATQASLLTTRSWRED